MPTESLDLLVFELDGQRYAVPTRDVEEIVRAVAVTPLPRAPRVVDGVINVRGRVAAVLDVRLRFGHPARPLHPRQHMILATAAGRLVALRVDRAAEIITVPRAAIDAPDRVVPGAEHVAGIARVADGVVLIHDLAAFLSQAEAASLDAALDVETGVRVADT